MYRHPILVAAAAMLLAVPVSSAAARPGLTEAVSVSGTGVRANRTATLAAISGSGEVVAFMTSATNLAPGDGNGFLDIYVRDRGRKATERISEAHGGGDANGLSISPVVSSDGRFVAFRSGASNLVAADANGAMGDVFVRDRATGTTQLASVSTSGVAGTLPVAEPAISSDGQLVAFSGSVANLVAGDTNATTDVFVRDLAAGTTERVSIADDETQAVGGSTDPSLSGDGRFVAFSSAALNLVAGDTNELTDVYVRDRLLGTTVRASLGADGAEGDGHSSSPSISTDGRFVAFRSSATNLVPADGNAAADVFVRDLLRGTTERVSVASRGAEGGGASDRPAISADGRFIAFRSEATNLVTGDSNGKADVFAHDRVAGTTELVSVGLNGTAGADASDFPSMSADGQLVAFESAAGNLVPGVNLDTGVYLRDVGPTLGLLGSLTASATPDGVAVSGEATVSGTVVSSAVDDGTDGGPGATQVGAEIVSASIVHRPEQPDVLLRLDVAGIPSAGGVGGAPGVTYAFAFEANGQRYEARVGRTGVSADPPGTASPTATLFRCDASCVAQSPLEATLGATGLRVTIAIPLALVGGSSLAIAAPRASVAAGDPLVGGAHVVDEVSLPAATLSPPRVELGVAAVGTPAVFTTTAAVQDGRFSASLAAPASVPGSRRVVARVCLGADCGPEWSVVL